MNWSGQPNFAIIFHKPSLLTASKAFGEGRQRLCRDCGTALGISPEVGDLQRSCQLCRVLHESHTDSQEEGHPQDDVAVCQVAYGPAFCQLLRGEICHGGYHSTNDFLSSCAGEL